MYGVMIVNGFSNQPIWAMISYPLVSAILVLLIFRHRFVSTITTGFRFGLIDLKNVLLFFSIPILTSILFQPLADSLRYNVAKVITIESIKDLEQHQSTAFLEVENWYTDKMQVLPLNTMKDLGWFQRSKVELNVLFLVPIFSRDDAYKSFARAWLAVEYAEVVDKKELDHKKGHPFFRSSLMHFRGLNLLAFNYLEEFPRGENREILTSLTRKHTFFKSGYGNIFRGQDVDRDLLSAHYFKYFLFLTAIVGLPILFVLAYLLTFLQRKNSKPVD